LSKWVAVSLRLLPQSLDIQSTSVTRTNQKCVTTPQERILFLNDELEYLRGVIAEVDELWDYQDVRDLVAEFRLCEGERDEILTLMTKLRTRQVSEAPPLHYEDWIPWAYEKTREPPSRSAEPERDYSVWWHYQKSKRTLVPLTERDRRRGPGISRKRTIRVRRKKREAHLWFLKILWRRLSLVISLRRRKK